MVGPHPEVAVLRGLRPQRHHVGHRGPQRTNATVAGTPVSPALNMYMWLNVKLGKMRRKIDKCIFFFSHGVYLPAADVSTLSCHRQVSVVSVTAVPKH